MHGTGWQWSSPGGVQVEFVVDAGAPRGSFRGGDGQMVCLVTLMNRFRVGRRGDCTIMLQPWFAIARTPSV